MSESELTEEEQRNAIITTITLDISNKHLKEVPKTIKNFSNIEFLYLSTNDIKSIPDHFFTNLPQLKWLDFRHNFLSAIPSSIGQHRQLRTLLLQGNKLTRLPIELGNIPTLSGLNIADNPLEYPPKTVLQQGTQEILKYLRLELQNECQLIPELVAAMEEVHLTENEGYLGRKLVTSRNHNISPQRPTWELSYLPSDVRPAAPASAPRPTSHNRLAMPRRARSQASIMRMRGAVRSPSPEHPRSPEHRNQRTVPRRPESTGRLFEFVPMMKPKRSNTRCSNISNERDSRSRSDMSFQTQDLYVEPRPKTSLDILPPHNFRSGSRHGYGKSGNFTLHNGNGFSKDVNGTVHNVNGYKNGNNRNGPSQFHNAWSDSHVIKRSM